MGATERGGGQRGDGGTPHGDAQGVAVRPTAGQRADEAARAVGAPLSRDEHLHELWVTLGLDEN